VYAGDARTAWRAEVYDSAGNLRSAVPSVRAGADPRYYTREYVERWIADFFPGCSVERAPVHVDP